MVTGEMAKALGTRVRMLRRGRGWSQTQLAEHAGIAAYQTVSKIEAGTRGTSIDEVAALAKVFDLSLTAFLAPLDPTMGTLVLDAPSVDVRPVVVELGEDTIIRLAKAIAQEAKQ